MTTTLDFVHEVRECIDTPFVRMGREPGVALDCVGLIKCAYENCGGDTKQFVDVPYTELPDPRWIRDKLPAFCDVVWTQKEKPKFIYRPYLKNGDLMALAPVKTGINPIHLGVLVVGLHGWNIVQAHVNVDKVCEHAMDESMWPKVRAVYRLRGLS